MANPPRPHLVVVESQSRAPAAAGVEHRADYNPAAVFIASLGEGSRRAMRGALRRVVWTLRTRNAAGEARTTLADVTDDDVLRFPWAELRYQHTAFVRAELLGELAPATANKVLSALRGVLKEAWRLGLIDAESYHRAVDLESLAPSGAPPVGRELSPAEAQAFFAACDDGTAAGARDAALFALLYGIGLRRQEAVALTLASYDTESGALCVVGKRGKVREVYAKNGSRLALNDWIAARGAEPGPLLVPVQKGGAIKLRAMTAQGVYVALRRRASRAGLRDFMPHDLRRTFAGDLLDAGADLATVQQLMGHASPTTTARYDRRGRRAREAAALLRNVPYSRTR